MSKLKITLKKIKINLMKFINHLKLYELTPKKLVGTLRI